MEKYKDIIGYEGLYKITKEGNILSLKRKKPQCLKPILHHTGYYVVRLYKGKQWKEHKVHRLVAFTFKANGFGDQVNHIDNNKTNNNINNLEFCSNRENCTHRELKNKKSSKYTGVTFCKTTSKWKAQIYFNRKAKSLGRYNTELEAYKVYKSFIKENNIVNKYH